MASLIAAQPAFAFASPVQTHSLPCTLASAWTPLTQPPLTPRASLGRSCMTYRPKRPRGAPVPPPPPPPTDLASLFERARDAWRGTTPSEKLLFAAAAGVAGLAAGSILNTLLSFAVLAVFGVFALPLFAVAASMSFVALTTAAVGFAAFSVFGVFGFGFIGVPLLVTGTVLFKLVGPLLIAAPALAWKRKRDAAREAEQASMVDMYDAGDAREEEDFFSQFDRKLADRGGASVGTVTGGSSMEELSEWSVLDCVASLRSLGMNEAAARLSKERIDGHVLSMMNEREIEDLSEGLPFGDRKRLASFARRFRVDD
jgi:hypothetical protein